MCVCERVCIQIQPPDRQRVSQPPRREADPSHRPVCPFNRTTTRLRMRDRSKKVNIIILLTVFEYRYRRLYGHCCRCVRVCVFV